jgi:hypothetical protein
VQASNATRADALVYSVRGDSLVPSGQVVGLPAKLLSTPYRLHLAADARSISENRQAAGGKDEKFVWPVTSSPEPASARQAPPTEGRVANSSPSGRFEIQDESEVGVVKVLKRADSSIVKHFSGGPFRHHFSSDDRWLVVWNNKDRIQVLDLARGEIEVDLNLGNVERVEFGARNTILNVQLDDRATLIPLDRALMERFARWLVPRELTPRERCQYGVGSKEECRKDHKDKGRSPDR